MLGGIRFFLNGNALVGVWQGRLIAGLGPDEHKAPWREAHVGEFEITCRLMRNWVTIESVGVADEAEVKKWVQRASKYVGKLPPK